MAAAGYPDRYAARFDLAPSAYDYAEIVRTPRPCSAAGPGSERGTTTWCDDEYQTATRRRSRC